MNVQVELQKLRGSFASSRLAPQNFIYAFYQTNTARTIADNDDTIVNFEDKVMDTHKAVTVGASWAFACPRYGIYHCSAGIRLDGNTGWAVGEVLTLEIYKNDSLVEHIGFWTCADNGGSASISPGVSGTIALLCNPTDTINFYVYQNSGGAINLNASNLQNWCTIWSPAI